MAMNIKNPEAEAVAHELAALTGETLTGAVTVAVKERRDRILGERGDRAARMRAISIDCAARLPADLRQTPHGELLYGPDGLPA